VQSVRATPFTNRPWGHAEIFDPMFVFFFKREGVKSARQVHVLTREMPFPELSRIGKQSIEIKASWTPGPEDEDDCGEMVNDEANRARKPAAAE
jgi:hypothetical protein